MKKIDKPSAISPLPAGVPALEDLLCDGPQAIEALEVLLAALENPKTEKQACFRLHELADALAQSRSKALTLQTMPVPGDDVLIRLILHSAVFSPELWGKTFAEGLLKESDMFDGKTVAELGTGSGWISLMLLRRTGVQQILGLDINPIAVLLARLNTWLNGTDSDGHYQLSQAGVPFHKAFRVAESNLLARVISDDSKFDHIVGCIPQVLHPDPESVARVQSISQKDLYDLSNYCFEQGILEDRFGLPLIASTLEQAQLCLRPRGKVTLILGGRPGPVAVDAMFRRRGYQPALKWSRRIPQADDTELVSLVKLERLHGIHFHFFASMSSELPISASTAVMILEKGHPIYHDLLVYEAETRFEKPTFGFVHNLHQMGLDSLRRELDFSRITEEQISFLQALSAEVMNSGTIRYPHERGDLSLRERLAMFLRVFCQQETDPHRLFIAPERGQLVELILSMVTSRGQKILVSRSLEDAYRPILERHGLEVVLGNDDLAELIELDNLLQPALSLIAPYQLNTPSPILLSALFGQASAHPDRWYLIDDSSHFDIDSSLGSNILLRLTAPQNMPSNMVLIYGLIKNTVAPDLELSFCLNAPEEWMEGMEMGAELTYSRIAHPTQLYYQWLFDDLLSFQFDRDLPEGSGSSKEPARFVAEFQSVMQDPVFAPKAIDPETPGVIRLDYGELEAQVPDLLTKGLFKGFLEDPSEGLPTLMNERVSSYIKATRSVAVSPERVVLAQGVFSLFGSLIRCFNRRLGRSVVVGMPDGSYGPCYPMVAYHGGIVQRISTDPARGFVLSPDQLANLSPRPDLLWLTQPNNPSGLYFQPQEVERILRACAELEIDVLADEIFFLLSDSSLGSWTRPSLSFGSYLNLPEGKRLFITDGLAKAFASGGLRCGFMVCPDEQSAHELREMTWLPPRSTLRAWDALYSAFLEEAPHQLMDVDRERSGIQRYLVNLRVQLDAQRNELLDVLKRHSIDDGLNTNYRGGLFVLAKLADPEKLATQSKLLVNPPQWGRTAGMSRICYSLTPQRFAEAIERLENFLVSR